MKFAVHTERGVLIVESSTPDEARTIVRKKYPHLPIKKVKRTLQSCPESKPSLQRMILTRN